MLINFFYTLRAAKLPVSVKEYLTLLEAIKAEVIGPSVDEFYYLARTTLVKDEANFDKFDRAFGAYFKGVEMLVDFTKAADAANRAVMAETDQASVAFAKEAEQATEAGALLHACSAGVKARVRSDLTVGLVLAIAAADAGRHTVAENINIQHNQRLKSSILDRIQRMTNRLEELRGSCYTAFPGQDQAGMKKKPLQASPGKVHSRKEWKSKSSIITSRKPSKLPRKNSRGKDSSAN